jgi:hypothetical protein
MRALEEPLAQEQPGLLHGTPVTALATLAAVWAVATAALPEAAGHVVGLAAAH